MDENVTRSATLSLEAIRLVFQFGHPNPEDPGWLDVQVTLEQLVKPTFLLRGAVSLAETDLKELLELLDELIGMPKRSFVPTRRRWETFEASIELQIEWSGESGAVSGRFEPLFMGDTSAQADFAGSLGRASLVAFRDEARAALAA